MTASRDESELPAILGGAPLFGEPPDWPPDDAAVARVLQQLAEDGSWGQYNGRHCERLIHRLRDMHDCEHVLLCSSGRAAIELALRGLKIEEGCEVAVADYDFHSNFGGIDQIGAIPLLVDVRREDIQLDVPQLGKTLAPATRGVIASHLHGGVVDMPTLRDLADERGLSVIEDACQASGATIAGRPAGMWGDVGVLSFGGSKLLSAGRGGALLTNRADVMQRIRRYLRGDNHAYALSEMQAAVLLPQLDALPQRHKRRRDAIRQIDAALSQNRGLRRFESTDVETSPAYYKVGFVYDAAGFDGLPRERFVAALRAEGLAVDAGLPALHTFHSPRRYRAGGELTHATMAGDTVVGLHHPVLLEDVDWSRLATALQRIQASADTLADGE